ncbi:AAA family ATPase [Beggiatoa leptomitoformis]|uniref:AAA family ATPase n=1 Tax=Beggiatoa leptomitoformis TaxID=288004 RepID=A0A2N9YDM8_9GAMM|nr:AAA family ATPase [Beggiatoa leptomitoformis]AUI68593.2 AAA family ATPase [Beggiatoa leptomitoformis]QGX03829.1 AAA family ATPase [Beggiatoa leptomitoformis]
MLTLPGYRIDDKIYEGTQSIAYRATRVSDAMPVVLKLLKSDYPSPTELAQYQREYDILNRLQKSAPSSESNVIRVYALEKYKNTLVMVLEDIAGLSLKEWLRHRELNITTFLFLAIKITQAIGEIHAEHVIHKDINPSNIVYNPASGELKLIDFGIASVLPRENPSLKSIEKLEGTLHYLSPEQTGRMSRPLDYRTDFYSFGITLYEMLVGRLPFETSDPLELVHCHIAKQPALPQTIRVDVPPILSAIIFCLLEKNAELRYQSAYGLQMDLTHCFEQSIREQPIELFILRQNDITTILQIPDKLYGNSRAVIELLDAFERVSQGCTEMVLVSGDEGIGKTTVVRELYKPVLQQQGHFITGKFGQFQSTTPYTAILDVFGELVRQVLTESEAQLAKWKKRLLSALGSNGQLIIDVIPEVALIIGEQANAEQNLGFLEAQNRFNRVFLSFMKVFCQPSHPLAIVLDDLQWADSASLKLLSMLLRDEETRYLLVIGVYRQHEVDELHPLTLTLDELRKSMTITLQITLQPLDLEAITQLLIDTLHAKRQQIHPLAEVILHKTDGNPLFIQQFIKTLYEENLLNLHFQLQENGQRQPQWQWNLEAIEEASITDNVADLLIHKLQKLPEDTQYLLSIAACLGNPFDIQIVADVYDKSVIETTQELLPALEANLIAPLPDSDGNVFRFLHNRVQETAYNLLNEINKQKNHLKIGRLLNQKIGENKSIDELFEITNHFNLGIPLVTETSDKILIANLNLAAARKAKAAAAYESAFRYLSAALNLFTVQYWQTDYALILAVTTEGAEVAYYIGDADEMERLALRVLRNARSLLDKIRIYEVRIQAARAQGRFRDALNIARHALRKLGIRLPDNPSRWHIWLGELRMKFALTSGDMPSLLELPEMTNPEKLAAMQILNHATSAAYAAQPNLMPLITFRLIQLSVDFGNTPVSAYAYATYGQRLCGTGFIESGYQFGELAVQLSERLNNREFRTKTFFIVNAFIRHWRNPVRSILNPLRDVWRLGLEMGEFDFASLSMFARLAYAALIGEPLENLEKEMTAYSQEIRQLRQAAAVNLIEIYHQTILNLRGQSPENPSQLVGTAYNEEESIVMYKKHNNRTALYHNYFNKAILAYYFQEPYKARDYINCAAQYLNGTIGSIPFAFFHFYESLILLSIYPQVTPREQKHILRTVDKNQKKLQLWATFSPDNQQHKYYLVAAERERALKHDKEAREYYDQAIHLAHEQGYLNEEAIACELAGQFYLQRGLVKYAYACLRDAHYAYIRWGAIAKAKELEIRHSNLFSQRDSSAQTTTITTLITQQGLPNMLDFASILKASQATTSELDLGKLLKKLMQIVLENAGAQRSLLVLEQNGHWVIEAEGALNAEHVEILQDLPLENAALSLPITLVNYVIRVQDCVVLNDACNMGKFTRDPYVASQQIKSILCMPMLNKGKLSGILYLENNLATSVFTPERVEILSLLSNQMAISLDNARLYKTLGENEERLRIITETTPIALSISRAEDGLILYANPRIESIFGLPPSTLINQYRTLDFYRNPDDREKVVGAFRRFGSVSNYEIEFRNVYNQSVWVALFVHPIRFVNQNVLLSAYYDITDIKNAEVERQGFTRALQESEERFRVIAETMPVPIFIIKPESGMILYANPQSSQTFGYSIPDLVERTIGELYRYTTDQQKYVSLYKQNKGKVKDYEVELLKADGSPVWVAISTQQATYADERVILTALHDITDRKRAEQEHMRLIKTLQHNEQLASENARMGAELSVSRQLQRMLLPTETELTQVRGLDVAAFMEPADEVGGDYYDILQCAEHTLIGIGDVTGHGLESGVIMLMIQMAVRTLLETQLATPEAFLPIINRAVYANIQRMGSDKSLTLSLIDCYPSPLDSSLTVLRMTGQHEEILVVRQDGQVERINTTALGFPIGLEEEINDLINYQEVILQVGDGIVLYTDGITEALNPEKHQYGVKRLCDVVSHFWSKSVAEINHAVIADVRAHLSGDKLKDDITLLVLKKRH